MRRHPFLRHLAAFAILLSGLTLAPVVPLHTARFGWYLYAQVYAADLEIVKSNDAPPLVQQGTQFHYRLEVTNHGPATATVVVVDDELPAQVSYLSDDCGGSFNAGTRHFTWTLPTLAVGVTATCQITVVVSAASGAIVNTASVASPLSDPDGANNSADDAGIAVGSAVEIPALGSAALAALAAALAVLAVGLLRRR